MTAVNVFGSIPSIFVSAVAPPLAIALAGYLLSSIQDVEVDGLSAAAVYVLLPALVFKTLVTLSVDTATVTSIGGAMIGFTFVMGLVVLGVSRARGQEGTVAYGAAIAVAVPNVGNFGIPIASFAFGTAGRSTAVLFVIVQNLLLYTIGIYLLSKGRTGSSRVDAFERVLTHPVTYCFVSHQVKDRVVST